MKKFNMLKDYISKLRACSILSIIVITLVTSALIGLAANVPVIPKKVEPKPTLLPMATSTIKPTATPVTVKKSTTDTKYVIYVDRASCKLHIYRDGKYYKYMPCCVGKPSTPTPAGTFYTTAKGFSFGTSQYKCKYATQFKGNYCLHSYLYDATGSYVIDARMGVPVSKGCIRLMPNDAQFICTLPLGTKVVIR